MSETITKEVNKTDENTIELVLIRHGITKANEERRFIGSTDEGLSEKGIMDIRDRYKTVKAEAKKTDILKADILFTSPMRRCIETAAIIYPDIEPIIIDELREIDFGRFEYKNHAELDGNAEYQAYIDSNGTIAFPDGEDMATYSQIVKIGLDKIKDITLSNGFNRAVAVVHGGTVMATGSILGSSDYFDGIIRNGESKVFRY